MRRVKNLLGTYARLTCVGLGVIMLWVLGLLAVVAAVVLGGLALVAVGLLWAAEEMA